MTLHELRIKAGSDPRNFVVVCRCGYAASGTKKAVQTRADQHVRFFADERYGWIDPRRMAFMPIYGA